MPWWYRCSWSLRLPCMGTPLVRVPGVQLMQHCLANRMSVTMVRPGGSQCLDCMRALWASVLAHPSP